MKEPALVKLDPARWVDAHGDCLYRYALVRVRNPEAAEDLVQDTLLVAVRSQDRFAGRSSERSWLVGILKHKIVDHYRRLDRETTFTDLEFLQDECAAKFWQTLRGCLGKLPPRVAAVFMLREMEEVPSRKICATVRVSEANLWVMLHRARMALRECLEVHWFDRPAPHPSPFQAAVQQEIAARQASGQGSRPPEA